MSCSAPGIVSITIVPLSNKVVRGSQNRAPVMTFSVLVDVEVVVRSDDDIIVIKMTSALIRTEPTLMVLDAQQVVRRLIVGIVVPRLWLPNHRGSASPSAQRTPCTSIVTHRDVRRPTASAG